MNWSDLWAALALFLVLEGMLPFLSPRLYTKAVSYFAQLPAAQIRRMGFFTMIAGVLLLSLVRF